MSTEQPQPYWADKLAEQLRDMHYNEYGDHVHVMESDEAAALIRAEFSKQGGEQIASIGKTAGEEIESQKRVIEGYRNQLAALSTASNDLHGALVECLGYIDRFGQDGVRKRAIKALDEYEKAVKP